MMANYTMKKKEKKKTSDCPQSTTQKPKDIATRTSLKTMVRSVLPLPQFSPPLVESVVLLVNDTNIKRSL